MQKLMHYSWINIIYLTSFMATVEEILERQRSNATLDVAALSNFIYGPEVLSQMKKLQAYAIPPFDFNVFNKSRVDLIKTAYQHYMEHVNTYEERKKRFFLPYLLKSRFQYPLSIHVSMFVKCLQMLGTQSQQQEWFKKAQRNQIFGCYAQTELGHGSDVQNLQTTATYCVENDTFIINTPSIQATKFWPGDLGVLATHALVFAQLIIHEKNHGVHPFIVPIRDTETFEPLPGIQVGDIGPKFGFHSKDNGFLIMNRVVIPKRNMLRKFVSVDKTGKLKIKGDPKISYATMMVIRQILSCSSTKIYAIPIIIAVRYSLFRTQFLSAEKLEIPIIDYQSQKQKIITRVAEYVALSIGGNAIKEVSDRNLQLVLKNHDFSLMGESHACLCLGKALFTEITYDGMQTCRRACGGHGFSHYSGLPSILSEYSSNTTLQGQNTVMYLQVTRFLLKNYKNAMTKKKKVDESTKYLLNANQFMQKRLDQNRRDWKKWTKEDLHTLLAQASCYNLAMVGQKMMNKPQGMSSVDVWNKVAGCEIKRAAISHALFYTFSYFEKAVLIDSCETNREAVTNLCLLFGTTVVLKNISPIIEGGFIKPEQISALSRFKQILLENLRPHLVAITDAFAIPQQFIQSGLAQGNPYQNYLDFARLCELNSKVQESALYTRNNISQAALKHMPKL